MSNAKPCIECHVRPKDLPRQRCTVCALRHEAIDVQVAECRRRLAMIPKPLRVKRSKAILAAAPAGTSWCAACQTFRDDVDFGKSATRCRACVSAKTHGAMIEKVYGLTPEGYDELLALQGGRCAICRNRPGKKKRFAVDHDHGTGAVRGLLCSNCNHDLLGAGYDSPPKLLAAWHYLTTPPATGLWVKPEDGLIAPEPVSASLSARGDAGGLFVVGGAGRKPTPPPLAATAATKPEHPAPLGPTMLLPVGASRDAHGAYRIYVDSAEPVPGF
ncbi:MAG: hypothetical protein JWO98_5295 [Frankiales bacterium]|nr:hypothetical protein [Frankiales bacterium]